MADNNALATVIHGDTLVFERTVAHPPERVWRAISDEKELQAWMRYPVSFAAVVGAKVRFFGEGEIEGEVFIADPPRTLAFSFWDSSKPEMAARIPVEWTVRWDLQPHGDGCRITFQHRLLGGAHLWGLGEGWHAFIDQLLAYLDGSLDRLLAARPKAGEDRDTTMLTTYRAHVSRELLAWMGEHAAAARTAIAHAQNADVLEAIDRLEFGARQFYEVARQDGPRPDYAPA
jgi:uncharacterized protein YndB with AHSA1/START domain